MNEAFFVDKTMQTPFRSWRQSLGALGEDAASLYLVGQGWRVIERNWRSYRACELDIVAKDPQGTVVFVEVKTRAAFIGVYGTESVESALASVDRSKQNKIKRGALIFLSKSQSSGPVMDSMTGPDVLSAWSRYLCCLRF